MTRALVIVESPAKAKTISRFLGKGYAVEASIGHVRDLPEKAADIPARHKKEAWSRLGVDVEHGFEPLYIVPARKREQVAKLKALLTQADELYLATDEDREGEAISWHLLKVLAPRKGLPVKRLVFHEITQEAIEKALAEPRGIQEDLVHAQETRRIVDRLYGYEVSPLLWKKVQPRLSAGRVQSVAVRLVVDRERERIAFRAADYHDLTAVLSREDARFETVLTELDGRRMAKGKDFDESGRLKEKDVLLLDAPRAEALKTALQGAPFRVAAVEEKERVERPYPPFTTSTLQQDANRRLGFSARRAMDAAQRLYEHGFITYMRTDSTALSDQAVQAARRFVRDTYGADYLPATPRRYETKVRNAQEAHEAIRPAGSSFRPIESADELGPDARRLYELIWKRTVACQMADARVKATAVTLAAEAKGSGTARFAARGKTIVFPGYLRAYAEGSENPEEAMAERETLLPPLAEGDALKTESLEVQSHRTQPPARLTEATLVKEMEARGIGRPSTYAAIIETILDRGYVFKKGNALVPSFTAFAVVQLLERNLAHLVDYGFTARMEDDLDKIAAGELKPADYLKSFYFGNGQAGLKTLLTGLEARIDPREVSRIPLGGGIDVRVGRYGPYLSRGEARTSIPEDLPPDELTVAKAEELLAKAAEGPRDLGPDPATGLHVLVRNGRFGDYIQLGEAVPEGDKPKTASLLAGMTAQSVTLEEALALLSLPRNLGPHPETGEPVEAASGRYGPYIRCGKESRSLPEGASPLATTLEEALALLKQPKAGRRARGAAKTLRSLGKHPESGAEVKVLAGRFGPYATDGEVNASLPRDVPPEALTLEQALALLAARAARGPARKRRKRK